MQPAPDETFDAAIVERWKGHEENWEITGQGRVSEVLEWVRARCVRDDRYRDQARIPENMVNLLYGGRRLRVYFLDVDPDRPEKSQAKTRAELDALFARIGTARSERYRPNPEEGEVPSEWLLCHAAVWP
jgi:hypothetical protein